MVRVASIMAVMSAAPALAQSVGSMAPASDAVRHSGKIVEVASDASSIVVEEIVAWTGPGTGW